MPLLGCFDGLGYTAGTTERALFAQQLGRFPDILVTNVLSASGPAGWARTIDSARWVTSRLLAASDCPARTVVGVPLVPDLTGDVAALYGPMLQPLAAVPGVEIRLGWEDNFRCQPWCSIGREAAYAAHFAAVVRWARAQGWGGGLRFHRCWGADPYPANDPMAADPGDDVIDCYGVDYYQGADPFALARDGKANHGGFGIAKTMAFARARGRGFMIHEAGIKTPNVMQGVMTLGVPIGFWNRNSAGQDGSFAAHPDVLVALRAAVA